MYCTGNICDMTVAPVNVASVPWQHGTHWRKKGNSTRTWKSMSTSQRESASYDHFQGHDKKHDLSLA